MARYNSRSLANMVRQLEEWIVQSEETLDNEESRDYYNADRVDSLTTRIDALQSAVDSLQDIES